MQAREYLEQVRNLNARVELKVHLVQSLRASLGIGSAPPDAQHVSHSRNTDAMGKRIAAIVDMEKDLDALIDQLVDLKREIAVRLQRIDLTEAMFLTERYLELKTPSLIAETHGVSKRWVRDMISSGIRHLQTVLDSDP